MDSQSEDQIKSDHYKARIKVSYLSGLSASIEPKQWTGIIDAVLKNVNPVKFIDHEP
jgi:hypothetical protein